MTKRKGKDMEKWMKCYVGTNSLRGSKGIYTLEINTQNGEMREVSTVEADDSAYLYVSEKRKCLYAVMESLEYKGVPGGGVAAYHIEDNKLSFLNSRYAYGGWPCHVIADEEKDSLLVSVFRNGLLVVYGINQDGSIPCLHRMENILRLRIAVLIIYIFMMQKRIKKFSSGKHRRTVDPDNSVSVRMENIYIWYLN